MATKNLSFKTTRAKATNLQRHLDAAMEARDKAENKIKGIEGEIIDLQNSCTHKKADRSDGELVGIGYGAKAWKWIRPDCDKEFSEW